MKVLNMRLRRRIKGLSLIFVLWFLLYFMRVAFIDTAMYEKLSSMAFTQHTRTRTLPPERGKIYDRNAVVLAENENVYTVFTVNLQIKDKVNTAKILSDILKMDYDTVLKKISKNVALEKIKTKVSYEDAVRIREYNINGIEIDEDYKRLYPFNNLLSHTLGFCGGDNQGIIGLEAKYDKYLKGEKGSITAYTDARGKKLNAHGEIRKEPIKGDSLVLTIDKYIQERSEALLEEAVNNASAKRGSLIVMNPKNGEILALCNYPDFNLNEPFTINSDELKSMWQYLEEKDKNNYLNNMWRNFCINDTYEPGSIFKIFTTTVGLETGKLSLNHSFFCPGYRVVEDRRIKCWRFPRSHGSQTVFEGLANSCNPVFIDIARRVGVDDFYKYAEKLKLTKKTGIDVSGEAKGIFLPKSKVGPVEISVMGFGQSFQITPIELIRMVSVAVNGGYDITPHLGKTMYTNNGEFSYPLYDITNIENEENRVISTNTSEFLKEALFNVVEHGGASAGKVEGYEVASKTATSEKLPRRQGKYIGGYLSFAPYNDPEVIALCLIDEPQGQYYGSIVALPAVQKLYTEILPYLGIEKAK